MFANLESFSIFFFISLALIILAIAFEDKLIALEKKYDKKKAAKRCAHKSAPKSVTSSAKKRPAQNPAVRNNPAAQRRKSGIAA